MRLTRWIVLFGLMLLGLSARAQWDTNYHIVSTSAGLREALKSSSGVTSGHYIWLMGGTYYGPFDSAVSGIVGSNVIIEPFFPWQKVTIDCPAPTNNPAVGTPWGAPGYGLGFRTGSNVTVRGLIFRWSHTDRTQGATLTDRYRPSGVIIRAPYITITGCTFYDVGSPVEVYAEGYGADIDGNVMYSWGWQDGEQQGTGHGVYAQNDSDTVQTQIRRNVFCNGYGYGVHIYGQNGAIKNIAVTDNIAINTGSHATNSNPVSAGGGFMGFRKSPFFVGAADGVYQDVLLTNNAAWLPLNYTNSICYQLYDGRGENTNYYRTFGYDGNWAVGGKTLLTGFRWPLISVQNSRFYGLQQMIRAGTIATTSFASNTYYYNTNYTNHETMSQRLFQGAEGGSWLGTNDWVTAAGETGSVINTSSPDFWVKEVNAKYLGGGADFHQSITHLAIYNFTNAHNYVYSIPYTNRYVALPTYYTVQNCQDVMATPVIQGYLSVGSSNITIPLTNMTIYQPIGSTYPVVTPTNQINAYRIFTYLNPLTNTVLWAESGTDAAAGLEPPHP